MLFSAEQSACFTPPVPLSPRRMEHPDVLASCRVRCTMPGGTPASPSDVSGQPAAPSAPLLLPALDPLADAGLASFMLPTPLLPELSSPHFGLSLLPTTLATKSYFLRSERWWAAH